MLFSDYDTRLAAYAVIIDELKRLLVTWWNGAGHGIPGWTMPGGGVEYDESLVEAVQREVLEETGYVVWRWEHRSWRTPSLRPAAVATDGCSRPSGLCTRRSSSGASSARRRSVAARTTPPGCPSSRSRGSSPDPP